MTPKSLTSGNWQPSVADTQPAGKTNLCLFSGSYGLTVSRVMSPPPIMKRLPVRLNTPRSTTSHDRLTGAIATGIDQFFEQ
jgi:hypothetical protein